MRHHLTHLGAALLTFLLGVTLSNTFAFKTSDASDERAVLAVEREYVRAHLERDVEALDRVLADDFTSFGGRVNKGHRLALVANPLFTISSLQTEGVEIHVSGDGARVAGRAKMTSSFRGREVTTPWYGFVRRYERRGGRWQIVSCHFSMAW